MATRSLTVIAQVKDAASAALRKVADSFNNTSKAVKKTSVDFTEFNRVLFSATAFVGLFTRAFDKMTQSLTEASELDRLSEQFERVVGPKGALFSSINGMTKNSIDRMEAMRSAISLSSLGIGGDTKQLAEIIARAGTAAKRAGFASGEGIKRVTDFLKEGSVSSLSFLNVLSSTNPRLQATMAILGKAGGTMGTVISTQAKLAMGMSALRAATQGMGDDTRDLMDVLQDVKQSFTFLRGETGIFLGKALSPIIDKVKDFNFAASDLIERIRKADSTLLLTAKNLFVVGSAIASVIATLGTARLFFKALGALGVGGIPFVTMALLGLAAAFTNVENATKSFTDLAKKTGAVFLGTFQLISSFIQDSNNFAKGIGRMDSELHAFLQKQGLLELTKNIARVSAVIITFTKDVGQTLVDWFKKAGEFIDPLVQKIGAFFNNSDPKGWARSWIEGAGGVRGTLVKLTSTAVLAFGAFKALQIGKGFLSKLPIIGKLFGGTGSGRKGPSGTSNDPIYTAPAGSASSFLKALFGGDVKSLFPTFGKVGAATAAGAAGAGGKLNFAVDRMEGAFLAGLGNAANILKVAFLALTSPLVTMKAAFSSIMTFFSPFMTSLGTAASVVARFAVILGAIAVAGAAIKGVFDGLVEQGTGITDFISSVGNLGGALVNFVESFVKTNTVLNTIYQSLKSTAQMFIDLPKTLLELIYNGWKNLGGWAGEALSKAAGFLNQASNSVNTTTGDMRREEKGGPGGFSLAQLGLGKDEAGNTKVASMPSMPNTEADKFAIVQEAISRLAGDDQAKMRKAFESAKDDGVITPEEWEMIFMNGMNKSKLTEVTEKQAKKPDKPMPAKTQRC